MEPFSGTDLLETFHNLGINTGNINKLTVDAWFETDCEATKEMFYWLCTHLGKENVLTAHENEEYEQSLEDKSLLVGRQYETSLKQIQLDYPTILDYQKNLHEVECMKDELAMLKDEQERLECLLELNGNLNKKLKKQLHKASENDITSMIAKKAAQDECLKLGYKLDGTHEKLQQQIDRYAEHLRDFEYATKPAFISNISTTKYDQYYSDIISCLGLFLRQENAGCPKFENSMRTVKKKFQNDSGSLIGDATDEREVLRQRIFKSMQCYLRRQAEEERLCAELKFVSGLNPHKIMPDESSRFIMEANICCKEELLERIFVDVDNVARQVCDEFVDISKISVVQSTVSIKQRKLEHLTQLEVNVTEILANQMLLHLLVDKEKNDFQSTDKFFRDVYGYITHDLQNCQMRTESMIEVINEYKVYKDLPLEQKFRLLNVIKTVIMEGEDDMSDRTAIEAVKNFRSECNRLEQQVFVDDCADHRRYYQQLEQEVEVMRKFLINGPTSQIVAIPHQITESFNKLDELLKMQAISLKSTIQVWNTAQKSLSTNKWLQMRGQLWKWFILEPKKVLDAIQQIQTAVTQKRNTAT